LLVTFYYRVLPLVWTPYNSTLSGGPGRSNRSSSTTKSSHPSPHYHFHFHFLFQFPFTLLADTRSHRSPIGRSSLFQKPQLCSSIIKRIRTEATPPSHQHTLIPILPQNRSTGGLRSSLSTIASILAHENPPNHHITTLAGPQLARISLIRPLLGTASPVFCGTTTRPP
jgi:hypothetical protein